MVRKRQAGFTLIEIIIVLAISSMLLLIILRGFSFTRGQAQFQAAIEQAKESVSSKRTEALANINISAAPGLDQCNVAFGRLITFTDGASDVKVDALYRPNTIDPGVGCTGGNTVTPISDVSDFTLNWGTTFHARPGFPNYIVFVHSEVDNSLQTLTFEAPPALDYTSLTTPVTSGIQEFEIQDPAGRTAYIQVDQSNGSVTRRYQ